MTGPADIALGTAEPAAPAAPVAPAAPAAPAEPQRTAQQALAAQIQELRGQITEEGGLPRPAVEGEEEDQRRAPDGTFAPPVEDAPTGDEPTGDEPAPIVDDGESEFVELELPSAREPGRTIRAMFPRNDPQLIEEIQFLSNNGMRRDEFNRLKTPVLQQKEELDYVQDRIRLSPSAFILETMAPEARLEVALSILAQEGVLEDAMPIIEKWTDPEKGGETRRADRAEIAREHADQRDTVTAKIAERRETRQFVTRLTDTVDTVATVLPKPELATRFVDDVLRDIEQAAAQSDKNSQIIRKMAPADLLKIVASRLELYGLSLETAVAALDPSKPRLPTARPTGDTARAVAAAAAARQAGKVFRQNADARRAVSAVPTPVAGAAPPVQQPPKGQTTQQRSDWVRSKLGLRPRNRGA